MTSTAPVPTHSDAHHDGGGQLLAGLSGLDVLPLWTRMEKLNPPSPAPKAIAHKWSYDAIRPLLLKAGTTVIEKQAERRVLMLVNPSMAPPNTTDTLYAGLQLVMPGETAPAHRHTAFACRFIIEGNGGFTAVHGKRIKMHRGDFILTPTWNFHDHGNESAASPMIWLDGLDLPNHQYFPCHFVQHHTAPRYPAVDAQECSIIYTWKEVTAALADLDGPHRVFRYKSKEPGETNAEVSKVIGAQVELIEAGHTTVAIQETTSAVYHVVEGTGRSYIGDTVIDWKQGDTFTVPAWQPYHHEAGPTAFLYRFDDGPMIQSLGLYRNATEDFMAYE